MKNREALMGATMVQLAICHQHLSARLNRVLKPLDLNMTRISILTHYSRQPGITHTISELAAVMEMNQPAVTKAVGALSAQGWLDKQVDEQDARVAHVALTSEGGAQLERAHAACGPVLGQAFSPLSTPELGALLALLGKLRAGVLADEGQEPEDSLAD